MFVLYLYKIHILTHTVQDKATVFFQLVNNSFNYILLVSKYDDCVDLFIDLYSITSV